MTEKKSYPEEIYPKNPTQTISGPVYFISHQKDYERAYDLGYRDGRSTEHLLNALKPLAGWSNLTEAIKDKALIDWEQLDGVEAKCVHTGLGTLTYKMERDAECPAEEYVGWYQENCTSIWGDAFYESWYGRYGWSLWVKGNLPLRKHTADQLTPGTCFKGKCMGEVRDCLLYQERPAYHEVDGEEIGPIAQLSVAGVSLYPRESREGADAGPVNWLASQVEVLEIYGVGTFQAPKED